MKIPKIHRWITTLLALLPATVAWADVAPFIITPPSGQTNYTGTTVTFTVTAGGDEPLFYFWQKNTNLLTDGGNISGSSTTNLTLANLSVADAGTYSVIVSNAFGVTNSTDAGLTVYTRLVQNGGFETGSLPPWTLSGNTVGFSVKSSSPYVHSGNRGARIGPSGVVGYLSQMLPTLPGQVYVISCWLSLEDTGDDLTPNEFAVLWDGNAIYDQTNLAATASWTNIQFTVTASDTNTVLAFGFQNDPTYFGFDDVSVLPVPTLQPVTNIAGEFVFTWNALAGFQYQLQSCTNLAQPDWSNLGDVFFTESNTTATVSNAIAPDSAQQFFRTLVLP